MGDFFFCVEVHEKHRPPSFDITDTHPSAHARTGNNRQVTLLLRMRFEALFLKSKLTNGQF